MSIQLIVGLRNPGPTYAETRHNVGAWFVEKLAEHYNVSFKTEKKIHGDLASLPTCKLFLPNTFMNLSGGAVQALCQFYRIPIDKVLVIHDDLDLPVGQLKLKTGGGHGGHNGLRDISERLGASFHRLRIGIGHPGHASLVSDYVLSKPSLNDRGVIMEAIERGLNVMPVVFTETIAAAMNQLNRKG